ncbi:MAG: metallophosphoesterase family protein [Bacteroidia bacterium]|nr:metallophosphoesterase family protein [Bacteroidia bacterium]
MNERLFAIGDIHGCFDSFRELVEDKIEINNGDKLVLLGDYIDRGKQSKEVIDYIIELQQKGFDIIPLIGNHESMLLNAIGNEEHFSLWIQNGGSKTMESFKINSLKDLPKFYIDFFKALPFYYSYKNFLFVHAGFNDEIINPFEDKYHMIWTCRGKYSNSILRDKTIIHGHSPISESSCRGRIQNNYQVINIDTGCVYSDYVGYGRLSAIELNSMKLFSV